MIIFGEFDGIHASNKIKQKTLHNVMKQRGREKRISMTAVLTLYVTCLLVILFQLWGLMKASPMPAPAPILVIYSYMTLDISPSMEWRLDEQQRMVRVTAYSKDMNNILTELQLEGVQLDATLRILPDGEQFSAYMKIDFLEVSVYSGSNGVPLDLEQQINQQLEEVAPQSQFHCSHLNNDTHREVQQHYTSARKCRVINEILRRDSAESVGELQRLSMKELYSVLEHYDSSAVPEECHGR